MLCDVEVARHIPELNEALFESVAQANVPLMHVLVQCGAEINAKDGNGDTPLVSWVSCIGVIDV